MLRRLVTLLAPASPAHRHRLGAAVLRFAAVTTGLTIAIISLAWTAWFLAAVIPAFLIYLFLEDRHTRLRANRLRQGLCPTCGYDLRASKEKCSECGELIALTQTSIDGR